MKKKILYCIAVCASTVLMTGSGCSYVMDSIEGAITNRSAFSITVEPTGIANEYRVDWSAAGDSSGEGFAGYEIYITEKADDELSGYTILASPYTLGGASEMPEDSLLEDPITTYTNITFTGTPNTLYYFRVGIIKWSEEKEADRLSKWTMTEDTALPQNWDPELSNAPNRSNAWFYVHKTELSKISGACPAAF